MFNVKSSIILQKKINIHEEYILFQWNVISYVNTVTSHIATTPLTHRPLVDFTQVIFKLILVSDGWGISYHFSKENSKHILQLNHKTDYHNVCSKNCKSQKKKSCKALLNITKSRTPYKNRCCNWCQLPLLAQKNPQQWWNNSLEG